MFDRFVEPLLALGHGANFAGQTHFTEHHQLPAQSPVAEAGDDGQHLGQVGGGFSDLDAAHHVHEYILIPYLDATMAMQHRQ